MQDNMEKIKKAMEILDGVPAVMLNIEIADDNMITIEWSPLFLQYRDILQQLGFLKDLDEVEFACKVIDGANKAGVKLF